MSQTQKQLENLNPAPKKPLRLDGLLPTKSTPRSSSPRRKSFWVKMSFFLISITGSAIFSFFRFFNAPQLKPLISAVEDFKKNHLDALRAFEMQGPSAALPMFLRLKERNPNDAGVLANLASVQMNLSNDQTAEASLLAAAELDPHNPQIANNLGVLYLKNKAYDKALLHLEKAQEKNPTDPEILLNLAIWNEKQGNWRPALEFYEKALKQPRLKPLHRDLVAKRLRLVRSLAVYAENRKSYDSFQ